MADTDTPQAGFTFSPLTPSAFLDRSAYVYRDRIAVVDGDREFTYRDFADRSRRLAGALAALGVGAGDRVGALCANSHVMLEMHNGVPLAGAVLVPLNVRLSRDELVYIVGHAGVMVLVATEEFGDVAGDVADRCGVRLVLAGPDAEYDALLVAARPSAVPCADERGLLAINYTSGTTGRPKGVMYHHRGAYLQALAMVTHAGLGAGSRYMWTLPMFHCDGWCFTWAVTAAGGTHVCLRHMDAARVWELLRGAGVTHFSAAPTVLTMIANAPEAEGPSLPGRIVVQTGGAPPGPALLRRMTSLGLDVTHLYGLTETYGPVAINDWHPEWIGLDTDVAARLNARQGVGNVIADRVRVVDETGADVPADGNTLGELVVRGNDVMLGYYRDPAATEAATVATPSGDCFRTGDLAVVDPDGYVEIRDRSKDVIISGGENISSVEVERTLDDHPAVLESAVVASPDEVWGEMPVAFLTLREGAKVTDDELRDYLRERIARFKVPKRFVRRELPKTSTGKIQKNMLRRSAREGG